ncbi:hypothetical protein EDC01DRAFT_213629 [Geopyxis carbonaria]|nr:hypothetical protein EDC01DRAFT_213629 [Geopyxis carbonaria]
MTYHHMRAPYAASCAKSANHPSIRPLLLAVAVAGGRVIHHASSPPPPQSCENRASGSGQRGQWMPATTPPPIPACTGTGTGTAASAPGAAATTTTTTRTPPSTQAHTQAFFGRCCCHHRCICMGGFVQNDSNGDDSTTAVAPRPGPSRLLVASRDWPPCRPLHAGSGDFGRMRAVHAFTAKKQAPPPTHQRHPHAALLRAGRVPIGGVRGDVSVLWGEMVDGLIDGWVDGGGRGGAYATCCMLHADGFGYDTAPTSGWAEVTE